LQLKKEAMKMKLVTDKKKSEPKLASETVLVLTPHPSKKYEEGQ